MGAAASHEPGEPQVVAGDPATAAALEPAIQALADDRLVAFATETVWGLGARAASATAIERLHAFKGRDVSQPISVLVEAPESLELACEEPSDALRRLVAALWPGPLTLVVRARVALAPGVARADGAVGLRCSPHPTAAALVRAAAQRGLGPITATSLNRSGEPPARTHAEARALCARADPAPLLLESECGGGAPSTVVDVTGPVPRILRQGAIPASKIERIFSSQRGEGNADR